MVLASDRNMAAPDVMENITRDIAVARWWEGREAYTAITSHHHTHKRWEPSVGKRQQCQLDSGYVTDMVGAPWEQLQRRL